MEISIDRTSIMEIEATTGMVRDEVSDFIYAVEAATGINALRTIYDELESTEGKVVFLAKTNAQHVAASVQVEVDQVGKAILTVKTYN